MRIKFGDFEFEITTDQLWLIGLFTVAILMIVYGKTN